MRPTCDRRWSVRPNSATALGRAQAGLLGGEDRRVEELGGCVAALDALVERVAGRFARAEPRRRAEAYVRGLLRLVYRRYPATPATAAEGGDPDGSGRPGVPPLSRRG
jgi:hypothetical protein